MSNENKTLKETVVEALNANKASAESIEPSKTDTEKGISQEDNAGETKSGETPVYVRGIDISDVPEQDRTRITELLEKKGKLLEDGYQPKYQEVAKFKKAQEELVASGINVDEAKEVLLRHIDQKRNPPMTTTEKKESLKTLDKLIDDAPYEQKSSLEQMRRIILEESDVSGIKKELVELKKAMSIYYQSALKTRETELNTELSGLSERFGKDFVDRYKDIIVQKGMQYPNLSAQQILRYEVPLEELEQAILTKGKKPLTQDKKNAISSVPSGISSASEKVDVKKSSYQELLMRGIKK